MGLKWSSLTRRKDIVQEPALPPPSTAHVPPSQARTHAFVKGTLQSTNDLIEDTARSSRAASQFPPEQWFQEPSSLQRRKASREVDGLQRRSTEKEN